MDADILPAGHGPGKLDTAPLSWALLACPVWAAAALTPGSLSLSALGGLSLSATWTLPLMVLVLRLRPQRRFQWRVPIVLMCCLLVAPVAGITAWLKLHTHLRTLGAVAASAVACLVTAVAAWLSADLGRWSILRRLQPALTIIAISTLAVSAALTYPAAQLVRVAWDASCFAALSWLSLRLGQTDLLPRRIGPHAALCVWGLCIAGSIWSVDWQRATGYSPLVAGPGALLFAN